MDVLSGLLQNAVRSQQSRLFDAAEAGYRQILKQKPDHRDALNNLAVLYTQTGKAKEADALFLQALQMHPSSFDLITNRLKFLMSQGNPEEEKRHIRESFPHISADLDTLRQLGIFLHANNRNEEAILLYRQFLSVNPEDADILSNLGLALSDLGEFDEGFLYLNKALQSNPSHVDARSNRALILLLLERHKEGWIEYGAHRQIIGHKKPIGLQGTLWNGEDLKGKTILLVSEQGVGDTLQFIRYAPIFKEKGALKVLLTCYPGLIRLLSHVEGVDAIIPSGTLPPSHDFYFFLMDAPRLFGVLPEEVPQNIPYIKADPVLRERWEKKTMGLSGFKVGLVWAGNPKHRRDLFRSLDPSLLLPLIQTPGCSFVSLQKPSRTISPLVKDWTTELSDFADTAASISCLDCVITVDTSVAHLAGAMGKSVWLLLPYAPDWRWMLKRSDSPWYPTARLFRQKKLGDWQPVLHEVQEALLKEVGFVSGKELAETADRLQRSVVSGSCTSACRECFGRNGTYREVLSKAASPAGQENTSHLMRDVKTLDVIGELLFNDHRFEEALVLYKQIFSLNASHPGIFLKLGVVVSETGRFEEGLFYLDKAVQLNPHPTARFNRAFLLLLFGRYKEAWSEFRSIRAISQEQKFPGLKGPFWNGEDLTGKKILLFIDKGFGDTIQLVRYASFFKQKGADKVFLACYGNLEKLLSRMEGVDAVVGVGSVTSSYDSKVDGGCVIPDHDVHFSLMEAPGFFGDVPVQNIPYITPDPSIRKKWKSRLKKLPGYKVGLVWAGSSDHQKDALRSIDPNVFSELLRTPGCSFISLQKENKSRFSSPFLTDWTEELADFVDTAALISELDCVITVDTAVAHLAGAMGKAVWVLLAYVPDWRWMLDRSDSPWYPTARLFRQKSLRDWQPVIEEVREALVQTRDG